MANFNISNSSFSLTIKFLTFGEENTVIIKMKGVKSFRNSEFSFADRLPEKASAKKCLKEFIQGKKFQSKLHQFVNGKYCYKNSSEKKKIYDNSISQLIALL